MSEKGMTSWERCHLHWLVQIQVLQKAGYEYRVISMDQCIQRVVFFSAWPRTDEQLTPITQNWLLNISRHSDNHQAAMMWRETDKRQESEQSKGSKGREKNDAIYLSCRGVIKTQWYNYPGQKKKEPSREEHCSIMWCHVRSQAISAEQKVADDLALQWPLTIEHDITWSNSVLHQCGMVLLFLVVRRNSYALVK